MDFEFREAALIMALIKVDRGVIEAACPRTLVHENSVGEFVPVRSSFHEYFSKSFRETIEFWKT